MKKLIVILPAFNEAKVIGNVIKNLRKKLKDFILKTEIVVIDDGSTDNTSSIAHNFGAIVIKHPINRGLGGALGSGLEYAQIEQADYLATFDADGQHDPNDLITVLMPVLDNQVDIVIGVRDINKMPFDRKILTKLSSWLTFLFFGVYCSDTQSGLRVFNKKAIYLMKIKTQRMEVSSEFFWEIKKHKLTFKEEPIKVIYTSYSRAKGQRNLNSINILLKLLLRLFR